jgi:hypothetical protein
MASLDLKKTQDALDKAFDEAVANLFRNLIGNLVEANAKTPAPSSMGSNESVAAFARGMKIAWDAYERAGAAAAQLAKPT